MSNHCRKSDHIPLTKPYLSEEEVTAAAEVIRSGWLTQGPKVAELEKKCAEYIGCKEVVAVSSATTALHLSLIITGVGPGDEVICPSYTFIATPNSILYTGAKPVFIDIDPETYNINPDLIQNAITPNTKAIMPAYQGLATDVESIYEIADHNNIMVIEDAAPAIGALYNDKKLGSESYLCCFSLHPRKVITCGEGGLIATNNSEIAGRLRKLRHHSMSISDLDRHKSDKVNFESYPELGYNYRMSDIHAAIAIVQLERLEGLIVKRRELAERYNKGFRKYPWLVTPCDNDQIYNTYQSYMIKLLPDSPVKRDSLMKQLLESGISTRRGFLSCHRENLYKQIYPNLELRNTEYCTNNCLILPLYPSLSFREQDYVIEGVKKIVDRTRIEEPVYETVLSS